MQNKNQLQIRFLGALDYVTGSSTLIEYKSQDKILRYLIDLGMSQNDPILTSDEDIINISKTLNGVFITHAHIDHIGRLPLILENGFNGEIYLTQATASLSKIMLQDQLSICNVKKEKIEAIIRSFNEKLVIFDKKDNFIFNKSYIPLYNDFQFMASRSSHILGSCSYVFRWVDEPYNENINNEDKKWLYLYHSGDLGPNMFGDKPNLIYKNAHTCYADGSDKFFIMESTYGNRLRENKYKKHENRLTELSKIINECQLEGRKLVIPTFSLDRAQQILLDINILQRKNLIHKTKYSYFYHSEKHTLNMHTLKFIYNIIEDKNDLFNDVIAVLSSAEISNSSPYFNKEELAILKKYQAKWNEFNSVWKKYMDREINVEDYLSSYKKYTKEMINDLLKIDNKYYYLEDDKDLGYIPIEIYSGLIESVNNEYINNLSDSFYNKEVKIKYLSDDFLNLIQLEKNERIIKTELKEILRYDNSKVKNQKNNNNLKRKSQNTITTDTLKTFPKNSIIISSSGMVDNGKVLTILEDALVDEGAAILLTGFQRNNTNGYNLKHFSEYDNNELYNKKIKIDSNNSVRLSDIKCKVLDISSYYSGHADQEQLTKYATWPKEENNRTIFLSHGNKESRIALKESILKTNSNINEIILPTNTNQWYILTPGGKVNKGNINQNIDYKEFEKYTDKINITDDKNNIRLDFSLNINRNNLDKIIKLIQEIKN